MYDIEKDISQAQREKLLHYVQLLKKWQKSINLVSQSTLNDVWNRHIIDSAQLSLQVPENASVLDIGSGAGFPGLVLAIIRPDIHVTCVESDTRKCAFMQAVARECSVPVCVANERIEKFSSEQSFDVLTARALAPLTDLLDYLANFRQKNPSLFGLFLKGKTAQEEISKALDRYVFSFEETDSLSQNDAKILKIKLDFGL